MKPILRSVQLSLPVLGAITLIAATPRPKTPPKPAYTITDLGTLGGDVSEAYAINNKGQITGSAESKDGSLDYAFLYDSTGMHHIPPQRVNHFRLKSGVVATETTPPDEHEKLSGCGTAINEQGQVAGYYYLPLKTKARAFVYNGNQWRDLPPLGKAYNFGEAINAQGQVTGFSMINGTYEGHAILYDGKVLHDLGTLGGNSSGGMGINDRGQIVGTVDLKKTKGHHAFLYENGKMSDLGTLGGNSSTGFAISEKGQVTGDADTGKTPYSHAFLYEKGKMRDLGLPGGGSSIGFAINAKGQVVGMAGLQEGKEHAFLYKDGKMTDLNSLIPAKSGWQLLEARGINDHGWIVGTGVIKGHKHAFLLKPIAGG